MDTLLSVPGRPLKRIFRLAAPVLSLAACNDMFVDPARRLPAAVAASFSIAGVGESAAGGPSAAFDKANEMRIVLTRENAQSRTKSITFAASSAEKRDTLEVPMEKDSQPAQLTVELLRGSDVLFAGTTAVTLQSGESTPAAVTLQPRVANFVVSGATSPMTTLGASVQLSSAAIFATGDTIPNLALTWTSSNPAVVEVTPQGWATAKSEGQAQLTGTPPSGVSPALTKTVAMQVRATPASLTIEPAAATLRVGATQVFNAVLKDASGTALTGRSVSWASDNSAVASVNANTGQVTGVAVGQTTIRATSEGITATAQVTVFVPQADKVTIEPSFASLDVGQSRALVATARDQASNPIQGTSFTWKSTNTSVATVDASGQVTGRSAGVATIEATAGSITGRVHVAVLGANSLLSTALPNGASVAEMKAGQTVSVPVVLDMSKASSNGDLGSVQFELSWDSSVLTYEGGTNPLGGAAFNEVSPGKVRFAYAGTDPVGKAVVPLVTFNFRVAAGAIVGRQSTLTLTYTATPKSTTFASYGEPITVGGTVKVNP